MREMTLKELEEKDASSRNKPDVHPVTQEPHRSC